MSILFEEFPGIIFGILIGLISIAGAFEIRTRSGKIISIVLGIILFGGLKLYYANTGQNVDDVLICWVAPTAKICQSQQDGVVVQQAGPTRATPNPFSVLDGKYSDYILSPKLFSAFPASLSRARKSFEERLQVLSLVQHVDSIYFGTGCMAHNCFVQDTAWSIDERTGTGKAIIMQTYEAHDNIPQMVVFRLYGASSMNELSPPLLGWARDHKMNANNITPDLPLYQAPPK